MQGWQPSASLNAIKSRAKLNTTIRQFFAERNVLEVETPLLGSTAVTAAQIHSFQVGGGFLQTSPEYSMKRLLAAGSGSIYQIAKAFRDEEAGRMHNQEFTLLEWYRVGYSRAQLMKEVAELLGQLLEISQPAQWVEACSYQDLFLNYLSLDPLTASLSDVRNCLAKQAIELNSEIASIDEGLDLLLSLVLEPKFPKDKLFFLYHYPASQSALAKLCPDNPAVAERFECFYRGMELANGFDELNDAKIQRARFEQDNQQRLADGRPVMLLDEQLLAALPQLPQCSGVALGLDRVLMLKLGVAHIHDVLSFSESPEACG